MQDGGSVYSLNGTHIGWFDGGVIYDAQNCALAFTRNRTGSLPSVPGIGSTPGMPGFSVRNPGAPRLLRHTRETGPRRMVEAQCCRVLWCLTLPIQ